MNIKQTLTLARVFRLPLSIVGGILIALILRYGFGFVMVSQIILILCTLIGTYRIFLDAIKELLHGHFGIDYIAILAIITSFITGQYIVGAVIALMASGGITLEEYGSNRAKATLTALTSRIPSHVLVLLKNKTSVTKTLGAVTIGETVLVRKGEVIALDGELLSDAASIDESSLTGEPYPVEKTKGDLLRSGMVNSGEPFELKVTKAEKDSTYKQIILMVEHAQSEKAPLVRLADRFSIYFTVVTVLVAGFAFLYTHSLFTVLSVLVVATPCPLILATPIALLGGVNKAAKSRAIVKNLASIEVLSRVDTLVFDKTGTLTLGSPRVTLFETHISSAHLSRMLGIAAGIERSSLHPLAKAIVTFAQSNKALTVSATHIAEEIGKGISGTVLGKRYTLNKITNTNTIMQIGLYEGEKLIGTFHLEDEVKGDAKGILQELKTLGLSLFLFTGDKLAIAKKLVVSLNLPMEIRAGVSPEDKLKGVLALKERKHIVAMVGDGINDAPALAAADVGLVFSSHEQTAATDAADIVLFGGDVGLVLQTILDAKRTVRIALESILWGIGLSLIAMVAAAFGLIPPVMGAILQELIDVAVILNALRASR